MSDLILPRHVAASINKQKKDEKKAPFVDPSDRVLDPSLLDKAIIDRLPQPTGWRLLVMPYQGRRKTQNGIILPDEVLERERVATVVAYVLKVGPMAYSDKEKYGDEPWCKEGQWVCIGRYAGSRFQLEDGEVRILNDDEIIATILDPDDIRHI